MGVAAGGDKTGGRLALCRLAQCRVPRGAKRGYGRIRTATDINGQLRTTDLLEYCGKPYLHKPRKRRYSHPTTRLLGDSPTTGAKPAGTRGVIAPLFASFASEKRGEWTCVLDPSGERSKAQQQQARSPRYFLNAATPAAMPLGWRKTEVPATRILAPASRTAGAVLAPIPPSTSMWIFLPRRAISCLNAAIFAT